MQWPTRKDPKEPQNGLENKLHKVEYLKRNAEAQNSQSNKQTRKTHFQQAKPKDREDELQ